MLKRGLFILLLVVCMVGLRHWLFPFMQTVASYICYPVIYLHHKLIDPLKHSQSDAVVLQEAYEQLLDDYIQLKATIDFHADIKELLEFNQRYNDHAILAQILERYIGADEQYILIDKGARHGIEEQMVLVYRDMLVGRVHQVFPLYSKCLLLTDQRCKIAAYCANTKVLGIAKGVNESDRMELAHVSHLCPMQENDLLISSGDGLIFPRGFGIAQVTRFHKDGLTYRVLCKPLVDIYTLDFCYVLSTY